MQIKIDFPFVPKNEIINYVQQEKTSNWDESNPKKKRYFFSKFQKIFLVMKMTIFFMIVFSLGVSAHVNSQIISYSANRVPIEKVFSAIEAQTGYVVFCDYQFVKEAKPVTVKAKKIPLKNFLDQILGEENLEYIIEKKTIIISKQPSIFNSNVPLYKTDYQGSIKGVVKNENGQALEAASIIIKGTNKATITDANGKFEIQATVGSILEISMVGYDPVELKVNNTEDLNIELKQKLSDLDSVVIIGYGTQKKVDLTGAVSTISGKDLVNKPTPNVLGSLQGMLPGVTVTRGGGQPGKENYGIRIRGFSSVNQPNVLVLIDGMEGDISLLNPNDIATMSVLKDAAASAIYGSRAAGGVILVTTKTGNSNNETNINLNAYYGLDITARQPQRLNSWDEETLINEARLNATGTPEFSAEQIEWLKNPNFNYRPNISGQARWDYYGNNNWIQEGMNKYNPSQNYTLSIGQGTKKTNYLLSGGYYQRRGVLKYGPDDNKRYNLRLNVNSEVNKYVDLSLRTSYAGSYVASNSYGATNIAQTLYRVRTRQPVFVPAEDTTGQIYNGDLQVNPIDIEKNAGETDENYEVFNGQADLRVHDLVKGLTVHITATKALSFYNSTSYGKSLYWYGTNFNTLRFSVNVPNFLNKTKNREYDNNLNAYATYLFNINNVHNFSIMGGWQFEEDKRDEESAGATGMITNDFYSFNYADATTKTNADDIQSWALGSWFGRFNYNYKEKYLFEANVRYDGSSKLAPSLRHTAFPSFSAGWNIFKESFMRNVSFVSNLKLRGSWGELGNGTVLGNYDYLTLLNTNTNLVFNNQATQYIYQGQLPSPNKTWERVQTADVGLDMGFLADRLSVSADYYLKYNKNMLATVQLPNIVGLSAGSANVGELKTWGWEFNAQWRDKFRNGSYSVGFNISNDQNKLVKYNGINSIGTGGSVFLLEGYPLNTIWGYKTDGYYTSRQDYQSYGVQSFNNANVSGGDVKYLDLNGDKVISAGGGTPQDPGDLVYMGTTNGHYLFGLNLGATWKHFDISVFFQGVGQRKFLIDAATMNPLFATQNMPWTIMMDRWTADNPNPNAMFPREYQGNNFNFSPSDKWLQNGAYIRLKNLQVGYTVPLKSNNAIKSIRIYFSGQDLWEATKVLSVFDPEVPDGVSAYAYPFYRVVAFGANFTF